MLVTASTLVLFGRLVDMLVRSGLCRRFCDLRSEFTGLRVAPTLGFLVPMRAIQALGPAMLLSSDQALIVDTFPSTERGRAIGFNGAAVAVGLSLGPMSAKRS